MTKTLTLFVATLFSVGSLAQTQYWAPQVMASDTVQCPMDSTSKIFTAPNWVAYQTTNNQWDGPMDSTYCIPFLSSGQSVFAGKILPGTYDTNRRVFLKPFLDTVNVQLFSNNLYKADLYLQNIDPAELCGGEPCNSIRYGIEIPDSSGVPGPIRWYVSKPSQSGSGLRTDCIPTEKFTHNRVVAFVISLKIKNHSDTTNVSVPFLEELYFFQPLDSFSINYFRQGADFYLSNNNTLVLYQDSTYPDAAHISHLDLYPATPTAQPDSLTVIVDPFASLTFQPFAEFRGGKVQGGNARHKVSIQMLGGNICLPGFVELIVYSGNTLDFSSGDIRFGSNRACVMIHPYAKLHIDEGAYMHYGLDGDGILALQLGSVLELEKGSTLLFDGLLAVGTKQIPDDSVTVWVDEGETIEFTEKSKVISMNGSKLVLVDNGGTINVGQLDENSRKNISIIYPALPAKPTATLGLNPILESIHLQLTVPEHGVFEVTVFDMNGRQVFEQTEKLHKGKHFIKYNCGNWSNGLYLVSVSGEGISKVLKVVKE